jgi:hypothetical protein
LAARWGRCRRDASIGSAPTRSTSSPRSSVASASPSSTVPTTSTPGGRSPSPAVNRKVASSSSGPSGAQACHAWTTAAAAAGGQVRWKMVAAGAGRVRNTREVTTPKCPPPAPRPEQLPVVVLVAVDDATVGQDDPCPEQVVAGQAVLAAEDPQPPAEGEAGDPDRGTTAGGDGQAMGGQRVVELAEPHAGTDGRHLARDRHRAHGRDVENDPFGRGPAGDRVPTAPDRRRQAQPARDGEGRGDIGGSRAADDSRRP